MPESESVVGRVRAQGVRASSPVDLVAIAYSRRADDADGAAAMAREILKRYGSIGRLAEASPVELKELTGLEEFEVLRCQALIELGRKAANTRKGDLRPAECPDDVAELLKHLRGEKREHFCAIYLDAKLNVMHWSTVHIGTLTMSVVGPREVFREAIREGASSIIVAHNHPSGDPTPSPEDIDVTKKLAEVGSLLDIPLMDHVIIGERKVTSLREKGILS
jgi:DNA repair protein RadC